MNVGAELAQARQNLGLTLEDVSTSTKISVERLSAIEGMDAERLPSLIYLKGFLRAYATEVQLDPEDVSERYLAEVDVVGPLEITPTASAPVVAAPAPADESDPDLSPPPPDRVVTRSPRVSQPRYFAAYEAPTVSEHDAPQRSPRWLPVLLLLPVAVLVGWFIGRNYDPMMESSPQAPAVSADIDTPAEMHHERPTEADTAPASEPPVSLAPEPPIAPAPEPPVAPTPQQPAARATQPYARDADPPIDAERAIENTRRVDAADGVSGRWTLTNRVESSSLSTFEGLNVGFHLQLQQRGNRVTGSGQKWMENGRPLPPGSRTPIILEGTRDGDRLELNFTERGTRRTSTGTFVLNVTRDGTLQGSFASDAANAQGTSLARRMGSP
jgi:transcriptional regulator with XRE-family HTH domain